MRSGRSYYFLLDVLAYFDTKGIRYRKQNLTGGASRIVILRQREAERIEIEWVTAFPLTNNFLEEESEYGFAPSYLPRLFQKIRAIPAYRDIEIRLEDIPLKEYNS